MKDTFVNPCFECPCCDQEATIMQRRLPAKILWATLTLAFIWFIVMFAYMQDLMNDEKRDSRTIGTKTKFTWKWGKNLDHIQEKLNNSLLHVDARVKNIGKKHGLKSRSLRKNSSSQQSHKEEDFFMLDSDVEYSYRKKDNEPKEVSDRKPHGDRVIPRNHSLKSQKEDLKGNSSSLGQKYTLNQFYIQEPLGEEKASKTKMGASTTGKQNVTTNYSLQSQSRVLSTKNSDKVKAMDTEKHGPSEISEIKRIHMKQKHSKDADNDYGSNNAKMTENGGARQNQSRSMDQNVHGNQGNQKPSQTQGVNLNNTQRKSSAPWKDRSFTRRTLTEDELLDLHEGYDRHSFSVEASEQVPLDRPVPDTRPKSCKFKQKLPDPSSLPRASIIICFHNEAWTTLMRTVVSVISRSPKFLLQEIILVDDYSTYDYLGARLEGQLSGFEDVYLARTTKREGLIRARMLGASYARAEVLVFLDSHCEVNIGWLEPLLAAIKNDRTKVVSPEIDIIRYNTFEYEPAPGNLQGTFDWNLQFRWKQLSAGQQHRDPSDPIRTATMIGGLFAVDRRFFYEIGAYDTGMDVWGSENLELSFRVWLCGGSLSILPCSRVGHLFRPVIPYGFPEGPKQTLHKNAVRVAEVWLDQYKKFFYATQDIPRNASVVADVQERLDLRHKLHCHRFDWFLKHISPETKIPPSNAEFFGQLKNEQNFLCLESTNSTHLRAAECNLNLDSQFFTLTPRGDLLYGIQCLASHDHSLFWQPCSRVASNWLYTKTNQLTTKTPDGADACLDIATNTSNMPDTSAESAAVALLPCNLKSLSQTWKFTYHFDINKLHMTY